MENEALVLTLFKSKTQGWKGYDKMPGPIGHMFMVPLLSPDTMKDPSGAHSAAVIRLLWNESAWMRIWAFLIDSYSFRAGRGISDGVNSLKRAK